MSRLRALLAAFALLGTLALAGCGTNDTAAVVNGVTIRESDAALAADQLNRQFKPETPLTTADAVMMLIMAPTVTAWAEKNGSPLSASAAASQFTSVANPSPSSITALQGYRGFTALKRVTPQAQQALAQAIGALNVSVNPRFGTFDPSGPALLPSNPNWLAPSPK